MTLTARLRAKFRTEYNGCRALCHEAAQEIERLEAENRAIKAWHEQAVLAAVADAEARLAIAVEALERLAPITEGSGMWDEIEWSAWDNVPVALAKIKETNK